MASERSAQNTRTPTRRGTATAPESIGRGEVAPELSDALDVALDAISEEVTHGGARQYQGIRGPGSTLAQTHGVSARKNLGTTGAKGGSEATASPASPVPASAWKSEGHRLLCGLPESTSELGRRLGCTKGMMSAWRRGEKMPSPAARRTIEETFGIPVRSWSETATTGEAKRPSAVRPAVVGDLEPWKRPETLEEIDALLSELSEARRARGLAPAELTKIASVTATLFALREKLRDAEEERERWLEDAIVRRHPLWARFREKLGRALLPFPEALQATIDEMRKADPW